MTDISGPVGGQGGVNVAWQGLQLLKLREQSPTNTADHVKLDTTSKRIGDLLNFKVGVSFWRPSADFLAALNDPQFKQNSFRSFSVVGENGETRNFRIGSEEIIIEVDDSTAIAADNSTVYAPGDLVRQVKGDKITLNVGHYFATNVAGNDITANVGGRFQGHIEGNNTKLNVAGDFQGSIKGDGAAVNVAGDLSGGRIAGDNSTVNIAGGTMGAWITGNNATISVGVLDGYTEINGNDATLNVQTFASSGLLQINGKNLTMNVETALGDVQAGANSYLDPKTGELIKSKRTSGEGDITLRVRTAAGHVGSGDGNDTLIVGSANTVGGGRGDDVIKVDNAKYVAGGWGDDDIEVGRGVEKVAFQIGDGHDTIAADSGTTLELRGIHKDKVRISAEDGTYRISFEGSDDTIELRTQDGATSRLTFDSRLQGSIELRDGTITYV